MIVRLNKLKALLANFVESLPLILVSRKKLEELVDAHSEVICELLDKLHEKEIAHENAISWAESGFERDFLEKHTLESLKKAWLCHYIGDISGEAAYDTSAKSWVPACVKALVLNKDNIGLITQADVEWIKGMVSRDVSPFSDIWGSLAIATRVA